jgi:hypothetical protein
MGDFAGRVTLLIESQVGGCVQLRVRACACVCGCCVSI